MPGDRYYRKKLEGRELMQWYFPSKYNLQDFRLDDYFEMQAERFAPREAHECMPSLTRALEKVSENRETLRSFFGRLDEPTFMANPTLQDLYGLFRLVDPDRALSFQPSETVFVEHSPLYGQQPPFRAFASHDEVATAEEEAGQELHALLLMLKSRLGTDAAAALEARVARLRSLEDVRVLLMEEAARLHAIVPFEQLTVAIEEIEEEAAPRQPASASKPAASLAPLGAGEAAGAGAAAAPGEPAPAETGEAERTELEGLEEEVVAASGEPAPTGTGEAEWKEPEDMQDPPLDPLAGFLGGWTYDLGEFEVSPCGDGRLLVRSQMMGADVSGQLERDPPDGDGDAHAFAGELRRSDDVAIGILRLALGDSQGSALLEFQRAGTRRKVKYSARRAEPDPAEAGDEQTVAPEEAGEALAVLLGQASEEGAANARPGAAAAAAAQEASAVDQLIATSLEAARQPGWEDEEEDPQQYLRQSEEVRRSLRLQAYAVRPSLQVVSKEAAKASAKAAEAKLAQLRAGPQPMRQYLARRHRFIDPMYRRRRLKWIERTIITKRNKEREIKYNSYYTVHPDDQAEWPTNKGSVTVEWPSPYH